MHMRHSLLAVCLLGASVVGGVVSAAPASAVSAVCPEGHTCPDVQIECPYGWELDWGTLAMEWRQEAYCLDPRAVPMRGPLDWPEQVRVEHYTAP